MAHFPENMQGQVAVVTGGGGGIGSAICRRLALAGAAVVILYRQSREQAEDVATSLPGENHRTLQASVTDSSQMESAAAQVASGFGRLDLLVNNAGITTPVPHPDMDALSDEWIDSIFATNWRGAFAATRAFRPLLTADPGGTVVNISSIAGTTGVGSNVAYCASKAALDSMTRSLGRALAPHIRVVSVAPGWVLGEYASRFDPAYIQAQAEATPLKRLATPEDVAQTVWAVATIHTFLTGAIVPVDGGRPLGTA